MNELVLLHESKNGRKNLDFFMVYISNKYHVFLFIFQFHFQTNGNVRIWLKMYIFYMPIILCNLWMLLHFWLCCRCLINLTGGAVISNNFLIGIKWSCSALSGPAVHETVRGPAWTPPGWPRWWTRNLWPAAGSPYSTPGCNLRSTLGARPV